jgi:hypothetical protein
MIPSSMHQEKYSREFGLAGFRGAGFSLRSFDFLRRSE